LCMSLVCGGCATVSRVNYYFRPEAPPDAELAVSYRQIELAKSTSADVLAAVARPGYEQQVAAGRANPERVSQGTSVITLTGQKKDGHQLWLCMFSFDENALGVKRKYFFVVDEEPKVFPIKKVYSCLFESQALVGADLLGKPYGSDSERRIAILKDLLANVRADAGQVAEQDKLVETAGAMIGQTLEAVVRTLEQSPVLTSRLSEPTGLDFEHPTMGAGHVWMDLVGNVVTLKVRIGQKTARFEAQPRPEGKT